jgi:tetraacyldisaccharide 4'-kinase
MNRFLRSLVLRPAAVLYRGATIVDRWWKHRRAYRSRLPVISIGNISTGGSGKTQVVRALLDLLQQKRPVIVLSRGYGRSDRSDRVWRPGSPAPDPELFGDEPSMLAPVLRAGAIGVASSRARLLERLEGEFPDAVVLLDDGFQHHRLARDLDIVIVDAATAAQSAMLPAGLLREDPRALRRADLVLVDSEAAAAFAREWAPDVPRTTFHVEPRGIVSASADPVPPVGAPLLVTGIAHPERVRRSLELLGIVPVREINFRDHQKYSRSEIESIRAVMKSSGVSWIVTTSKDAVKLRGISEVRELLYVLEVGLVIDDMPLVVEMIENAARWSLESDGTGTSG